jgi:ATP/maltotriose-dependent transcriptional regulator MalT
VPTSKTQSNKEDILVQAFLTDSNISRIAEKTGICRQTVTKIMQSDSFREKLANARQEALASTITYLQGNLQEASECLLEIIRDKDTAAQVRINAINSVFSAYKQLSGTGTTDTDIRIILAELKKLDDIAAAPLPDRTLEELDLL